MKKKPSKVFNCKACDYVCSKSYKYKKHLATTKCQKNTKANISKVNVAPTSSNESTDESINQTIVCSCGKSYHHRQGLWRHKKTCTYVEETPAKSITEGATEAPPKMPFALTEEMFLLLIKQNAELISMLKTSIMNNSHIHHHHHHYQLQQQGI
jgi:hypothetical protein